MKLFIFELTDGYGIHTLIIAAKNESDAREIIDDLDRIDVYSSDMYTLTDTKNFNKGLIAAIIE